MNARDLIARLRAAPTDPDRYRICEGLTACFLARSPSGRPTLLVPCIETMSGFGRATGAILLTFKNQVVFDVDDTRWTAPAVVLECLDETVLHTFVALSLDLAVHLADHPSPPRPEVVLRLLAGWERLLRSHSMLSDEKQIGLWGELEFIRSAPSLDGAIRAWNPDPNGTIDFVGGGSGVEIKTSTTRLRHSISQQQGESVDGGVRVLFASLWLVHDAAGKSLGTLVRAIADATSETVAFEQKLLATGFSRRDVDCYSRRFSLGAGMVFFEGRDLPRIRAFDSGISSIRYTVELEPSDALEESDAAGTVAHVCGLTIS